jgi:penicillin G amidase
MKWIKRILISVVVLALACMAIGYFWLKSSAPNYNGDLQITGLSQPVDIHFDEYGVPHIYAQNKHDLYMAFGYVHAQDRLFQMEMIRRAGSGRLAEIIGRPVLKVDKLFRSIGLKQYAQESAAYINSQKDTPLYNDMMAYLEGLNYYISNGKTPPEFSLIGIPKEPFTVEDIFFITGAMSFSFSQAQKTDPIIDYIHQKYGNEYLEDLGLWHGKDESFIRTNKSNLIDVVEHLPGVQSSIGSQSTDISLALAFQEIESLLPYAPLEGSNSWVVDGKHTKSGKVMFCNDTHIGYLLPQTWYEAHLNCPDFEIYGHFMSGVPFALVGRNSQLSWGLTMLLNDDMDFYHEKINTENPSQVWNKDHWSEMTQRQEVIKIKGEADTILDIAISRHGPIVNKAFDGMNMKDPIAMFWAYTQLPNRTMDALYGMNNSKDLNSFQKNLPLIHGPGLNVNYGDAQGNIAWWGCAALIKRPGHVNSWTILDGASGADDPLGYYPFDKNPSCINPEWGYIYSANDWPQAIGMGSDSLLWYPGYYKPQYRADRIRSLLEGQTEWDYESMKKVMTDEVNVADSELMAKWLQILSKDKKWKEDANNLLYSELFDWNGSYNPINPSPALFNYMLYEYLHLAMEDEMGADNFNLFLSTHQVQRTQELLMEHPESRWWDNVNTEAIENQSQIIHQAYSNAIGKLTKKFGSSHKVWNWRKVCTLELKHPMGEVKWFRPLFNIGPDEVFGSNETILQSGFKLDSTGEYKVYFGSQMRIIVDFAQTDSALNITPSGQSGHLMSEHYSDQHDLYMSRQFRTQWMRESEIRKFEKLYLHP